MVRLDNGQRFDNPVGIVIGRPRLAMFDPQSCGPGSFRHRTFAQSLGDCKQCTKGHYCDWQNCIRIFLPIFLPVLPFQGGVWSNNIVVLVLYSLRILILYSLHLQHELTMMQVH